jgi:hypothetical protein
MDKVEAVKAARSDKEWGSRPPVRRDQTGMGAGGKGGRTTLVVGAAVTA